MNRHFISLVIIGLSITFSCKVNNSLQMDDVDAWKLGWRMTASSMDENFELASLQFDSLRNSSKNISSRFLATGLEAKSKIGNNDDVIQILNAQSKEKLQEICVKSILSNLEPCVDYSFEKVENKALQLELIKMYVDDQASRGNFMQDLINKYKIDSTNISLDQGIIVDKKNRDRLKEIIEEFGFPTRELVGLDAMKGIFFIIQHSDEDKDWQKLQLLNIEKAVAKGDMDGQNYAYLYDRIKINNGEKQLYGTQFANVDPNNKIVELAETEDLENLDRRRMEMGMMPIQMYKDIILKFQ